MTPVSFSSGGTALDALAAPGSAPPSSEELETRDAFRKFVAGTFYQQMLKSLRKMHDKPHYLHGGQAEEIFRQHLDMQLAEDLADKHGAAFADPLFAPFLQNLRSRVRTAATVAQGN